MVFFLLFTQMPIFRIYCSIRDMVTDSVWVMTVCSVVGGMLVYYIISAAQSDLDAQHSKTSHVFIDMFGSFVNQTFLNIPLLSAGRVSVD